MFMSMFFQTVSYAPSCAFSRAKSYIWNVRYVVALRIFFFVCSVIKNVSQTTEFHPEYYCSRGTHNVTFFLLFFVISQLPLLCVLVYTYTNPEYPRFISCFVWEYIFAFVLYSRFCFYGRFPTIAKYKNKNEILWLYCMMFWYLFYVNTGYNMHKTKNWNVFIQ